MYCILCGKPLWRNVQNPIQTGFVQTCDTCLDTIPPYPLYPRLYDSPGVPLAAVDYSGVGARIIREVKFRNQKGYLGLWVYLLIQAYNRSISIHSPVILPYNPLVVPVPPSEYGLWSRGWDPVGRVAGIFARHENFPCISLIQRKGGSSQKLKLRHERLLETKSLFIQPKNLMKIPKDCSEIILVDDVVTTGATLAQIAEIILEKTGLPARCITIAQD